jgi:two-component system NtrC family sensor kinase
VATRRKSVLNKAHPTASDIAERKQDWNTLPESEERFRALIENSADAITVLNADGSLRYESPSMTRMMGYEPGATITKTSFELVHPDDMPSVTDSFDQLLKNPGGTVELNIRVLHRDGSWRTLEVIARNLLDDPVVAGIVVNQRDITQRKQAEEALRESEEKYRTILEDIEDGYYEVDIVGNFTFFNDAMCGIIGYSKDEMIGMNNRQYMDKENAKKVYQAFNRVHTTGKHTREFGWEIIRKDGTKRFIEASVSLKRNSQGEPIGFRGIIRDITERKQMEQAVRDRKEEYSALVENLSDAVFHFRDGVVVWCNDKVSQIYGHTKDDFLGKDISFFLPDETDRLKFIKEVYAVIKERGHFSGTTKAKARDGSLVDIEYSISKIPGKYPAEVVAVARDVTEHKRAEKALEESEEKFRRLVEEMNDGYCVLQGARVVFANARGAEMFGYAQEEVIDRTVQELLTPEIVSDLSKVRAKRQRGEAVPQQYETLLVGKEGTTRPVELSTRVIDYTGKPALSVVLRDITERKRAEETLLLKEKAIENSVSAIAMSDMEGRVTYLNRACMRFWGGANKEELLGKPYWLLLKSDDVVKDIATAMFKNDVWEGELVAARKNGEEVTVQVSAAMVRDEHGNPIQTISSFLDITELRRLGEEKQRMEEQLQITGRLAAVGELTAGVAHELNNPLAAVQAYAELLNERDDLDETTKSDVETIYKEAQRASRITSNLLSFARRYKPEKGLISINDVLRKSLELHAYRMKVNNIEIVADLDPDLPMLMADFHQMQQVFVNIITNAEQAMTEAHGRGSLHVKTRIAGETIRITFTDSGPGIPEANLKRIFDPFFTTKDVGEGTGLGLSICYGIVQEHGGHLYARSKPGQGATFVVEIPVIPEDYLISEEANSTHHLQSTPRHL